MPTASEIRVSIDVGCHRHSVAIGLPTGEVLEEFDLLHRPEGFDLFFAHVERYQRRYERAGRVENRLSPALPHQTVHAVFPHTAFRCSSHRGMR